MRSKRPSFHMVILTFKDTIKHLFHDCPYYGLLEIYNVTSNRQMMQFFPTGIYKLSINTHDDIDSNIVGIDFYSNLFDN